MTVERRLLVNLAWGLLATDLALIVLHVVTGLPVFDLDREANLSAWYSSAKLALIALLSAAIHASVPRGTRGRRLWLINAAIFLGLSADESASLHERSARWFLELPAMTGLRDALTGGDALKTSFAWVWLFLPLILATTVFFGLLIVRGFEGRQRSRALFGAGLAAMLSALTLEAAVSRFPSVIDWGADEVARYRRLTTLEESAELIGVTLVFAAVGLHLAVVGSRRHHGESSAETPP